ncbi:hypothetical protein IDJ75_18010 [Mucilaginibacter rigui]|uniref:Apple domain-containing protein n=1 Tax=Mucilaginibacter rigui TaxID=534635 RepID=A0ABR7X9D3_9SPHI|nr:hypothetical protein [Mucilaginibacter rigui]MBD1387188.1 hypothetical protein [Mucilaginibacter rigui]
MQPNLPGRGYGKEKLNYNVVFMSKFNKLSRAEMKNVLGGLCMPGDPNCGGGTGTKSCSCTLTGAQNVKVDYPLPASASASEGDCSSSCKAACDGAPLCSAYSSTYASSTPQ